MLNFLNIYPMYSLLTEFNNALVHINPPVAVAVSGGADSMALLLLAKNWAEQKGGEVIALTVDHGLRPESAQEAHHIHTWATTRGLKHVILTWEGEKPISHLQEKAREARYRLLLAWCQAHHVPTLLLGHHAQDQEETFWLRLSSGSGLVGLAGMKKERVKDGIKFVRPLLDISPHTLKEFLQSQKQEWIEDPSNKNKKFFRGRFRAFLQEEGLSSERLLKTIGKLQEDADFIQEVLKETLEKLIKFHKEGYVSFPIENFNALHPALAKRVLAALMQWFSGKRYPPRSQQLEGVLKKLKAQRSFTTGSIYWFHKQEQIYLSREPSAIERPLLLQDVRTPLLWDQRFWIDPEIRAFFPAEARVGSAKFGAANSSLPLASKIPRRIWPSLPAIWVKEEVVAIPHLCYTSLRCETDLEKYIYLKPLFHDSLRFTI